MMQINNKSKDCIEIMICVQACLFYIQIDCRSPAAPIAHMGRSTTISAEEVIQDWFATESNSHIAMERKMHH